MLTSLEDIPECTRSLSISDENFENSGYCFGLNTTFNDLQKTTTNDQLLRQYGTRTISNITNDNDLLEFRNPGGRKNSTNQKVLEP